MLSDAVYAHNYGKGPSWVNGTITDVLGPYNFMIEVNHSGQLYQWKRHVDQLKKHLKLANLKFRTFFRSQRTLVTFLKGRRKMIKCLV